MKHLIQKIGMTVVAFFSFVQASAYDFVVDGLKYEIISLDEMTCKVVANDEKYVGDISIPASVSFNGKSFNVVSIERKAFYKCDEINNLDLASADNLVDIGFSAFEGCTNIQEVKIPSKCNKINSRAFYGCTSLKSIIFSESTEPLVLQPEKDYGEDIHSNLIFNFGQFAQCPIEHVEILRDIQYGGYAVNFHDMESAWFNSFDGIYFFPWVNSCTKDLKIGSHVTKIPYNLLLTMNPQNLILEDSEEPLDIEPLTTKKRYSHGPDVYGDYDISDDGYIYVKDEDGNEVYDLFWGFRMPELKYVYWGRQIKTSEFNYRTIRESGHVYHAKRSIELFSDNLTKFEYGKTLKNIGNVSSVSSSCLTDIIWNTCIEECKIFKNTPEITELRFPDSLKDISGFSSTGTLQNLYFGSKLTSLSGFGRTEAKNIHILATTPPELGEYSFNDNIFIESNLYVPIGCKDIYSKSNIWSRFWNILEEECSGITDIVIDGVKGDGKYYDLRGNKLDAPKRGINIINGKKVVAK